jgi:hypothetical protein
MPTRGFAGRQKQPSCHRQAAACVTRRVLKRPARRGAGASASCRRDGSITVPERTRATECAARAMATAGYGAGRFLFAGLLTEGCSVPSSSQFASRNHCSIQAFIASISRGELVRTTNQIDLPGITT